MTVWQSVLVVYVLGALVSVATRPKNVNEDYGDRAMYALIWFVYAQMLAAGALIMIVDKIRNKKPAWSLHYDENGSAHVVPGPKVDDK